ncbi:MAG: AAC(3) family N-acetyltransferase [Rhodospirillales bacterium]
MSLDAFRDDLADACAAVGTGRFDALFVFADLRGLAVKYDLAADPGAMLDALFGELSAGDRTVIINTFSYTSEGRFDVLSTPSKLGAVSKYVMRRPDAVRSDHPLFSHAAFGPDAERLRNIGKAAFGHQSAYMRFMNRKAGCLHVGRPVEQGDTMIHFVEQMCGATYRFNKAFRTEVWRGEEYVGTDYSAFLRRLDVPGHDFVAACRPVTDLFERNGLTRQVGDPSRLTGIALYSYDDAIDAMGEAFYRDPSFFITTPFIQY